MAGPYALSVTIEELQVDRREGVVEVVFNRPKRRNAFTADMYAGMRTLCDELREDESVRPSSTRRCSARSTPVRTSRRESARSSPRSDPGSPERRTDGPLTP